MQLDPRICERARLSRDPRFDGRFFVGVTSTGIYCRPICPARSPARRNVRYFATAAAAAAEGLRPCRRCRPESAPGSAAWNGVSTTVSRALRLIASGRAEGAGVASLSDALGVTPRHLHRLFVRYLGASPQSIVTTQRLHFAMKLLDETPIAISDVALASGFGSVRRFNDAFREAFDRTPREVRARARRMGGHDRDEGWSLRLTYRPPLDWDGLATFLAPRATPGVEEVDGAVYRRCFELEGRPGVLEVEPERRASALRLRVDYPEPRWLFAIAARVRRMFDLDAEPREIAEHLRKDRSLARSVRSSPGLRVPGAWDGFELAVRAVLGQQVSVRAATTLAGRLASVYGRPVSGTGATGPERLFPRPSDLRRVDASSIGLTGARAETLRRLAAAAAAGRIVLDGTVTADETRRRLSEIRGIGPWTVEYIAMRALGDPDAFPASDLGLRNALARGGRPLTPAALARRAERWRPWRAYAALHLWRMLA